MLYLTDSSTTYFHNISTLKCRQLLEGTEDFIMEIRKYQVQNDLNYIWLKITKDQNQIKTLNLKFTDSSQNVKELFFEEGYLKFNDHGCVFIEKFNSNQHHYQVRNIDFSNHFNTTLSSYLLANHQS